MQFDYYHYRFLQWKVGEYINLPYGEKRVAHAYMMQFIEDRNGEFEALFGERKDG